jgi:hypothetical protein
MRLDLRVQRASPVQLPENALTVGLAQGLEFPARLGYPNQGRGFPESEDYTGSLLTFGSISMDILFLPPLERSYSNNQYGNHPRLDLRVREGLNHG